MSSLIPGYMADAMTFASKRLFNATIDGDIDFAVATMQAVITTLNMTLETYKDNKTYGTY